MSNIDTSKWKEFRLDELFTSINGDIDIKKEHINDKGDYVITAGETNRGILGRSDIEAKVVDKGTLTVDMFGYCVYRDMQYKLVTHARVFSLIPKKPFITDEIGLWFESAIGISLKDYSYENMCSWGKIKNIVIKLPVTEIEEIDYEYMENYIKGIEDKKKAEIEELKRLKGTVRPNSYLSAKNLDDYDLTEEDKEILNTLSLSLSLSLQNRDI